MIARMGDPTGRFMVPSNTGMVVAALAGAATNVDDRMVITGPAVVGDLLAAREKADAPGPEVDHERGQEEDDVEDAQPIRGTNP